MPQSKTIAVGESELINIIKKVINEKQELKEALNCNDFGAQDCTIDCCRDREGGDGIGRKMSSIAGCTTGGPCTPFDACADGTSSCVGSVRRPNDVANDAEREIDTQYVSSSMMGGCRVRSGSICCCCHDGICAGGCCGKLTMAEQRQLTNK